MKWQFCFIEKHIRDDGATVADLNLYQPSGLELLPSELTKDQDWMVMQDAWEQFIARMGLEGWELVTVLPEILEPKRHVSERWYFKRQLP